MRTVAYSISLVKNANGERIRDMFPGSIDGYNSALSMAGVYAQAPEFFSDVTVCKRTSDDSGLIQRDVPMIRLTSVSEGN